MKYVINNINPSSQFEEPSLIRLVTNKIETNTTAISKIYIIVKKSRKQITGNARVNSTPQTQAKITKIGATKTDICKLLPRDTPIAKSI